MAIREDIKVGTVGTVYDVPIFDDDLVAADFDPSLATIKMPSQTVLLTRDATALQKAIGGVTRWCLRYTVVAADVMAWVDANTGGFHQAVGVVQVEPYIEFGANQKFPGSTVRLDQQGRQLKVIARLAV